MSNINFNSGTDDYNSLKEAIFKRAREKAEALNNELKESYTSDIKSDIMDSARISVRNNPFMNFIKGDSSEELEIKQAEDINKRFEKKEIRHSRDYNYSSSNKGRLPSKINNELYTAAVREGTMREASMTLKQNKNVIDSLKFLNTQAAIALNKKFINTEIETPPVEIKFGV